MTLAKEIRLFDDRDRPWIGSVVDLVALSVGQPWRVALERVEHAGIEAHPSRIDTVVRAIKRLTGGKAASTPVARKIRALVLGHPALDREAREARLATAAASLGLAPGDVESLLWADLALERPVVLPRGRPDETTLLAFANLDRVQRAVRRARSVQIRAWDRANDLVRTIARYGLIAHVSRGAHGETLLDVAGPLSLFHSTTVYGSALAQLVPLLAEQPRFTLDVICEFDGLERTLRVERLGDPRSDLCLPSVRPSKRAPSIAQRLAKELEALGRVVEREPPPIASGDELLFPELSFEVDGAHWFVEVIGFSTAEYLTYKLSRYQAAGVERIVLCVDTDRTAELLDHPRVLPFRKRIALADLRSVCG
jgi:predicted nuclease of restriction endonuclease-like RecB superfamily